MAAPSTTARQNPPGIKLPDGFSSKIAFSRDPDLDVWERTVKPSGTDGGEPIDVTTMHNTTWRTKRPRSLKDKSNITVEAGVDPSAFDQLDELVNEEGSITQIFPDGGTESVWGFLKSWEPSNFTEGEMPTVTLEIVVTNWDPVNRVEAGPARVEVTGT